MKGNWSIGVIEPGKEGRRRETAEKLAGRELTTVHQPTDLAALKLRLRSVREATRPKMAELAAELTSYLADPALRVGVCLARDGKAAIDYLVGIAGDIRIVSVNNSAVIAREIGPSLRARGFTVINSYFNEFDVAEAAFPDYWGLPGLTEEGLIGAFSLSAELDSMSVADVRPYLAVLGVNALAPDGSVFFLEHLMNIMADLRQARKVIIVAGLDKIARSREEAAFVTECMGIFGMESVLLEICPKPRQPTVASLPIIAGDVGRELHLILLDNGRSRLAGTPYEDLLLCIGCRACNRRCPIRYSFSNEEYIWTPRTYLAQFLDRNSSSLKTCLHCDACRVYCPLDIDLPGMMWLAERERTTRPSFNHWMLGRPESIAKAGSLLAPLVNLALKCESLRQFMEITFGLSRHAALPVFRRNTFRRRFKDEDSHR